MGSGDGDEKMGTVGCSITDDDIVKMGMWMWESKGTIRDIGMRVIAYAKMGRGNGDLDMVRVRRGNETRQGLGPICRYFCR